MVFEKQNMSTVFRRSDILGWWITDTPHFSLDIYTFFFSSSFCRQVRYVRILSAWFSKWFTDSVTKKRIKKLWWLRSYESKRCSEVVGWTLLRSLSEKCWWEVWQLEKCDHLACLAVSVCSQELHTTEKTKLITQLRDAKNLIEQLEQDKVSVLMKTKGACVHWQLDWFFLRAVNSSWNTSVQAENLQNVLLFPVSLDNSPHMF